MFWVIEGGGSGGGVGWGGGVKMLFLSTPVLLDVRPPHLE